jgi:predicted metal-dependent hydrolase
MVVPPGADAATRSRVLTEWYRARLKEAMPALVAKWEEVVGVDVAEWRVKRMRTRWGSCNVAARRIWVNLELVKRPVRCLEYVIVHEMVHLLERRHRARFRALMDRSLPDWRAVREELRQPLATLTRSRSMSPSPVPRWRWNDHHT